VRIDGETTVAVRTLSIAPIEDSDDQRRGGTHRSSLMSVGD